MYARYEKVLKDLGTQNLILSVPAKIIILTKEICVLSKETAERLRTTSHLCQGRQIFKCCQAKSCFY